MSQTKRETCGDSAASSSCDPFSLHVVFPHDCHGVKVILVAKRVSPPRGPAGKSLTWVSPPPQAVSSRPENQVHSLPLCGHTEVAQ
ncbi:hypothetical protein E2C01_054452 [Portunus trituberculatus]|uniref:Uncharacterized protein n=1 Tax=Portunus trituberculatus TaxID=210409 RepID=A0A5B7GTQ3_PORTR|nr:hypothetical protein [Portunus trituberculatus]